MINRVWTHIHSILIQMMTSDPANCQTCPFRVWGTLGFLTLVIFMGIALYLSSGANFDPANYGGAMAAYLIAWGGAILAAGKVNKE